MRAETPYERQEPLLGPRSLSKLRAARVAVFGLGGVGGSAAEADQALEVLSGGADQLMGRGAA